MILVVHLHGAVSHDVGDEIWQESLGAAIRAEAESIVFGAELDLLEAGHNEMRDRIVAEMSEAGDSYRAPDGIWYSLIEAPGIEGDDDTLIAVSSAVPVVEEVLRFEVLPTDGSRGGRGGHGHDGPLEPSRIVVCGRCGHEDGAGSGLIRLTSPDNEYETAKAARVARHHAEARVRKWHSDAMTLRGVTFPIYAAETWPARITGSGSSGTGVEELRAVVAAPPQLRASIGAMAEP